MKKNGLNSPTSLSALLAAVPSARIGVLGDFCLDVYWALDESASEQSVETGLPTRPVRQQRYSLGGAGTVVNNLSALGVGRVAVFGVIGADPFGREVQRLLGTGGTDATGMLIQTPEWNTPVYIKPIRADHEENRIDFGGFNTLADEVADALLARLAAALPQLDVVVVNQQLPRGIHTPHLQAGLNALFQAHPGRLFIVDSRDLSGIYTNCLHKLNDVEATRLCGQSTQARDVIALEDCRTAAQELYRRWRQPVFVTRGARGCLVLGGGLKAVILLNNEPEFDSAAGAQAKTALAQADMVVSLNPFKANMEFADVLLPIAPFAETSGSFVNAEGCVQSFHAVVKPLGETRPAWKVLRVLANLLDVPGFEFESSQDVLRVVPALQASPSGSVVAADRLNNATRAAIDLSAAQGKPVTASIYQLDGLVRRASSLQMTADAKLFCKAQEVLA